MTSHTLVSRGQSHDVFVNRREVNVEMKVRSAVEYASPFLSEQVMKARTGQVKEGHYLLFFSYHHYKLCIFFT